MEVNVVPFRREPGCVHTPPHPLETRLDFITLYIPVISAAPARCCWETQNHLVLSPHGLFKDLIKCSKWRGSLN